MTKWCLKTPWLHILVGVMFLLFKNISYLLQKSEFHQVQDTTLRHNIIHIKQFTCLAEDESMFRSHSTQSVRLSETQRGYLFCIIWNSKSFQSSSMKLGTLVWYILKMCTSYLQNIFYTCLETRGPKVLKMVYFKCFHDTTFVLVDIFPWNFNTIILCCKTKPGI